MQLPFIGGKFLWRLAPCYTSPMEDFKDILKIIASMVIPYIALLRTRTDLDRFAAAMRAKELGLPADELLRKRWYHRLKGKKDERTS